MAPKIWVAVMLVIAAGALAWIAVGSMGKNLVYYWTPSELVEAGETAQGATVRLGGMVKAGSIEWDKDSQVLQFVCHDGTAEVHVRATQLPPDMFRENIGVVVEGQMGDDGVFQCNRMFVKHDNEYRAPHDPKEVDVEELWNQLEGGQS
jgi:cytochrome c-type biogenesis protein CcmE